MQDHVPLEPRPADEIIYRMGYRPTKEHIEQTYKIEVDDVGIPIAPPAGNQTSDFAETADVEEALEAILSSIDNNTQQQIAESLAQPLLDAIDENPDYILGLLAERYPNMDGESLHDLLTRIIFAADTWGRLNA